MNDALKRIDIKPSPKISMDEVLEMGKRALNGLKNLKEKLLVPRPQKMEPVYSIKEVCELLNIDRNQLRSAQKKLNLLFDEKIGKSKTTFSLTDYFAIGNEIGAFKGRPEGKKGFVIAVASYKGGVGKTTTAITLAQGLSLKGLGRGLVIDLDGQSSASTLMGLSPEFEDDTMTVMDYIFQDVPSLKDCIQPSYWPGLDIISGSSGLMGAEYHFAGMIAKYAEAGKGAYPFWSVLPEGLEELKDQYAFIVIDTAPSLGYLTQNALQAADGLIAPLPQEALDFASMAQFWDIYGELVSAFPKMRDKAYDFVEILISKAKPENSDIGNEVKKWIKESYGAHVSDISIPESKVVSTVSAAYCTVLEVSEKDVPKESYRRYREPVLAYVDHIYHEIFKAWSREDE